MSAASDIARFWSNVDKAAENGCWEWTGTVGLSGYARFQSRTTGGRRYAHRVAWEIVRGQIPEGLQIDHLCRNRRCVNPEHLEPVTQRTNVLRGVGPSAKQARQTHCLKGHPFDEVNTYRDPRGRRKCRRCNADMQAWRRSVYGRPYDRKKAS